MKFAVARQPIPSDYICEQDAAVEAILDRLEMLEDFIKDIETGNQEFKKFENMVDAAKWAKEEGTSGDIIIVYEEDKWVPYVVENDLSLSPICNYNGEAMNMGIYVPRFEHDKLIFELKDTPGENEVVYDLNQYNEWRPIDGAAGELGGDYIWNPIE